MVKSACIIVVLLCGIWLVARNVIADGGKEKGIFVMFADDISVRPEAAKAITRVVDTAKRLRFTQPMDENTRYSVDRARAALEQLFKKCWGSLVGVAKVDDAKGAIIAVKWGQESQDKAVREALLWDAIESKILLLRIDRELLETPDRMKELFNNTLVMPSHLGIHSVHFQIKNARDQPGVIGKGWVDFERMPAGSVLGYEFDLFAVSAEREYYLCFRMGRKLFSQASKQEGRGA